MTTPPPRTESELVELVRSLDVRAPDSLHRQVESMVADRAQLDRRRTGLRRWLGIGRGAPGAGRSSAGRRLIGVGALAAAAAVALVVALSGGGSAALTVRQASALTLRPATAAAPPKVPGNRAELAAAVDGVAFPYWEDHFGWRSTGARTDRAGGRTVTTVFYTDSRGRRIGYAIVAGATAPQVRGGALIWRGGTPYRLQTVNGVPVVTWLRDGHLCVVSGRGVDSATLLRLVGWADRASPA